MPGDTRTYRFGGFTLDAGNCQLQRGRRAVGRQLNVGSLLEGSVRKSGDRVRISAQLIDAANGYHVWSEQYDRRLVDVFAIQDEISAAILDTLKVRLLAPRASARRPTDSLDAYHLYLKGRTFWHRRFRGQLQNAVGCFEQAIALDPRFALAYVGLADCFGTLGVWAFAPPASVLPRARELASRALEIDDSLAEAHASLAFVDTFYTWDFQAAARGFDPANPLAHFYLGYAHAAAGNLREAAGSFERAQRETGGMPWLAESIAWVRGRAGERTAVRAALDDAARRARAGYVPSSSMALLHLGLGDDDAVLGCLEQGLAERDALTVWLPSMPAFDGLRGHPRFDALIRTLGLAQPVCRQT